MGRNPVCFIFAFLFLIFDFAMAQPTTAHSLPHPFLLRKYPRWFYDDITPSYLFFQRFCFGCQFLLFRRQFSFYLFYIFRWRQRLRFDISLDKKVSYFLIVFHMLAGNTGFRPQVVPLDIEIGYLVGKVFCLDCNSRQKISQSSRFRDSQLLFHLLGGISPEQSRIPFTANTPE